MESSTQSSSESFRYRLLASVTNAGLNVGEAIRAKKSIVNSLPTAITAVVVLLLVLAAIGVEAHVWRNSAPAATSQRESSPTTRGPAQIVRFTVYDAGIFPREVRVGAGLVALQIEDVSGGPTGLVVANESGQTVGEVVRRQHRSRHNSRLSLVPGRYTVYDPSRPASQATLIVER